MLWVMNYVIPSIYDCLCLWKTKEDNYKKKKSKLFLDQKMTIRGSSVILDDITFMDKNS